MALSTYGTNHALAVRFWAKKLAAEALRKTFFSDLIGRSTDSVIVRRDEMKEAGDRITVGLRAQLTGAGVAGDGTLEGNEEALATYGDTLLIDQLRNGVRSAGRMNEQRVLFDFREEAKAGLSDWIADRWDTSYFNQICGFTTQNDTRYTGNNAVIAPDSNHIYRPNSRANDESLTTGDEFNLGIIDLLVARAAQFTSVTGSGVPIRPATFNGQKKWIMFIHDYQAYQLRTSAAAGSWVDYQKALVQGGVTDTALFKGGYLLGEYNGVLLVKAPRITNGVNSTSGAAVANVRRAVLVGAQSAMFALGSYSSNEAKMFEWVEEDFDYGNQRGIEVGSIFGCKKTRFNGQDLATIVASTYSPAP